MRAVSNTSPLLNLAIIDRLDLIRRQFERVEIPRAVLDELQVDMDESEGRSRARALALIPVGVVGVLLRAREDGDIPAVKPFLRRLQAEVGFFLREDFVRRVLESAGETL